MNECDCCKKDEWELDYIMKLENGYYMKMFRCVYCGFHRAMETTIATELHTHTWEDIERGFDD